MLEIDPLGLNALQTGRLPSAPREVQPDSARGAAEAFAGYLFAEVFRNMRPDPGDDPEGLFSGEQSGMFMDFFDQALGKQYARPGNPLVEQLVQQLVGTPPPGSGHGVNR